jgi:hypothetical protein
MLLYSLSPGAYDGLRRLAQDPRWCPDYDRILRYIDVVVCAREAALLGDEPTTHPADSADWIQLAILDTELSVSNSVHLGPVLIKKL